MTFDYRPAGIASLLSEPVPHSVFEESRRVRSIGANLLVAQIRLAFVAVRLAPVRLTARLLAVEMQATQSVAA